MILKDLKKKKLPDSPGVYFFKGKDKKILYIGKATSLKSRVKSYFGSGLVLSRGPQVSQMMKLAVDISFEKTDSVLEALILEANLIKKHQPKYNTKEKDDKSFQYVVITKEDFPRVLLVRGKDLDKKNLKTNTYNIKAIFGPFPKGGTLKEAIKIIRRIFPFRDKCKVNSDKQCFNRQLGLCPGVCSREINKKEYGKVINNIKLFFEGKKKQVIKNLEKQMKEFAKTKEFEKAANVKKTIFALGHIQDISLLKNNLKNIEKNNFRIEAYDIAHTVGTSTVGVFTVLNDGEIDKNEYRKFKIKSYSGSNDIAGLREILERRLAHREWQLPDLIVVDGGVAQKNIAEKILKEKQIKIPIIAVVKDERHKANKLIGNPKLAREHEKAIILINNEAHRFAITFHRKLLRNR